MAQNILRKLEITVPEKFYERVLGILARDVSFGWEEESKSTGETVFRVHCANASFLTDLKRRIMALSLEITANETDIENRDWQSAWKEFFTSVACGTRFVALPPWLADSPVNGRQKLIIEPECAFGTGHHASTTLCLAALSSLLDAGRIKGGEFLDLGCGSGILGIACALSGMTGLGVDIDELAIANASRNCEINNIHGLELAIGGIEMINGRKFDLILANILARPLIELAPAIAAALKPGGALVLSGILDIQSEGVEAAYKAVGMRQAARMTDGEWRALIWS